MNVEIVKEYAFEAAHFLPNVPDGHKCKGLHGHSYKVRVCVWGAFDPVMGWVCDFGDVSAVCKPDIQRLDHSVLNDRIPNPTAENVAIYLLGRWASIGAVWVEVQETATAWARASMGEQ